MIAISIITALHSSLSLSLGRHIFCRKKVVSSVCMFLTLQNTLKKLCVYAWFVIECKNIQRDCCLWMGELCFKNFRCCVCTAHNIISCSFMFFCTKSCWPLNCFVGFFNGWVCGYYLRACSWFWTLCPGAVRSIIMDEHTFFSASDVWFSRQQISVFSPSSGPLPFASGIDSHGTLLPQGPMGIHAACWLTFI